nr:unnamed protein product [Callosobruchus analis]
MGYRNKIFPYTEILFDVLQKKSSDIGLALALNELMSLKKIHPKREEFQCFWNKTRNIDLEPERK